MTRKVVYRIVGLGAALGAIFGAGIFWESGGGVFAGAAGGTPSGALIGLFAAGFLNSLLYD